MADRRSRKMTTPAIKVVPRAGELDRDANGNPEGLRETTDPRWPVNTSTINSSQPVTAKVDQSHSGNVNHHLPWLMIAAILGAIGTTLGVVLLLIWLVMGPDYLRALAKSEAADVRVEMNAELARVGEQAANAREDAKIALRSSDRSAAKQQAEREAKR